MKRTALLMFIASFFLVIFITTASAQIRVIRTRGQVAYSVGRQWMPLRAGQALPVGARISTGIRSEAVLNINGDVVTLRQLTMVKVYQSSIRRLEKTTKIGLRRGSVNAKVKKNKKIRSVFRVASPVATSSVRGTEEENTFGPARGHRVLVLEGWVEGRDQGGGQKIVRGLLVFKQKPRKPKAEPLLGVLRDKAIADIQFRNVTTSEEGISRQFFVGDMPDAPFEQNRDMENSTSANARIFIIWN